MEFYRSRRALGPFLAIACLAAALPVEAQRLRQLSDFTVTRLTDHGIDDDGSTTFFIATADPAGTNPDHVAQVFRVEFPGGMPVQVTTLTIAARYLGVADDGDTILFVSNADPLGSNPDRVQQLFVSAGDGSGLTQITTLGAGTRIATAALSGDGRRAVFVSDADPTGGNPSGVNQLFTVATTGTLLAQLTSATVDGTMGPLAIDDMGRRIAFVDGRDFTGANPDGSRELFRILTPGTDLTQVTADADIDSIALSGDGQLLFYSDGTDLSYLPFTSNLPTSLGAGRWPTPVDDGSVVFFQQPSGRNIQSLEIGAGPAVDVYTDGDTLRPRVSGDGTRLLFEIDGGGAPILSDPDAVALVATEADGSGAEPIVDVGEPGRVMAWEMTADGAWVVFPWGEGHFFDTLDLYLADVAAGSVTRLTTQAGAHNPDISDDGGTIVFSSAEELLPGSCSGDNLVFPYRVDASGAGLDALFPEICPNNVQAEHPAISGDGSTVVLQATGDTSGLDDGPGAELYAIPSAGGPLTLVTDDDDSYRKTPRIDGSGSWAVYHAQSNVTGANPDGGVEIFRASLDGATLEQITDSATESSARPDISADGGRIVFHSTADFLGTNPENNAEIFGYTVSTDTLVQLTATATGDSRYPRISSNGAWVAFSSTAPFFDSFGGHDVYRLDHATATVERAGGGVATVGGSLRLNLELAVDDGGNVTFQADADLTGANPDRSLELWVAAFDEPAEFRVGAASPTVLSWDPWPWAISYDAIRGDLSALAFDGGGGVDLGAVVCLEDDSLDATTVGNGDPVEPAPGAGFFYLRRGTRGDLDGPGSWGAASDSVSERTPSAGGCPG